MVVGEKGVHCAMDLGLGFCTKQFNNECNCSTANKNSYITRVGLFRVSLFRYSEGKNNIQHSLYTHSTEYVLGCRIHHTCCLILYSVLEPSLENRLKFFEETGSAVTSGLQLGIGALLGRPATTFLKG